MNYAHISSGEILRHEVMSGSMGFKQSADLYQQMFAGEAVAPNVNVDELIFKAMVRAAADSYVIW